MLFAYNLHRLAIYSFYLEDQLAYMTREMCVCVCVRVCLVHIESAFESSFLIYGEFAHLFALPRKQLLRTNMPAHNNGKSTVKLQNARNETIVCVSAEMMITYHLFF